jgi:ABC-type Fe3+-hydroxamate transport system substrate-binding protein
VAAGSRPARSLRDDTGTVVDVPAVVGRVVSLVPSLTEAVEETAPGLLVGATDWCTHPPGLDVARVRGTKNPDVAAVRALVPDLVLANAEENREPDLAALRDAGLAVWVTDVRTVPGALDSLAAMLGACALVRPAWLDDAVRAWGAVSEPEERRRAFVPIWRKPWMALGRDTFAGDVLARLGVDHVHADAPERYPRVSLDEVRASAPDLVVCPDEPYAFGPERDLDALAGIGAPVAFVSGRHLTWYGPSLAAAPDVLRAQLARTHPAF